MSEFSLEPILAFRHLSTLSPSYFIPPLIVKVVVSRTRMLSINLLIDYLLFSWHQLSFLVSLPPLHFLFSLQGRRGKAPIYSIDFHPDASRFATGGGDYKVRRCVLG